MRKTTFLLALISLLAGAAVMITACRRAESLLVSQPLVVPAVQIPPYTVIRPEMLAEKAFPRALAQEPLYTQEEELVGKITTVPLEPGQLVYHGQVVPPSAFRLAADPALELLSFPVDPARSLAGRLQAGQRVILYRQVELEAQEGTAVEVLAQNILVVDAQTAAGSETGVVSSGAHILTVAVPHQAVLALISAAGGSGAEEALWVSLAPALTTNLAHAKGASSTAAATPPSWPAAGERE